MVNPSEYENVTSEPQLLSLIHIYGNRKEKAMAVAMDSQEARRRMEEGRLYLPGDEAIMAEQMDCLEKQYDYLSLIHI